jgi:hypothetical protein
MANYARIENGAVAELITSTVDPATLFNLALVWEQVTDNRVAVGWLFANGSFLPPPAPTPPILITPSLAQLQAELATIQAQIAALSGITSASGG